jgi:hypothetical protein
LSAPVRVGEAASQNDRTGCGRRSVAPVSQDWRIGRARQWHESN